MVMRRAIPPTHAPAIVPALVLCDETESEDVSEGGEDGKLAWDDVDWPGEMVP